MPPLLSEEALEPAASPPAGPDPHRPAGRILLHGPAQRVDGAGAMSLHVSKLRGMTDPVRAKLKRHGISYTHQLDTFCHRAWSAKGLLNTGEVLASVRDPRRWCAAALT